MAEPSNVIVCPSCGHQNEPSRVFCHNCGVRLPRDEKLVEQIQQTNQAATATANALRRGNLKLAGPKIDWEAILASAIASLVKLAIVAALLAAILLALRPPADVPPPLPNDPDLVQRGDAQLDRFTTPGVEGTLSATPQQLNTYLQTKIVLSSEVRGLGWKGEDSYLFLRLGENRFTLGNHFLLFDHPVVLQADFALGKLPNGRPTLHLTGGSLGSLPLPAWIFVGGLRWFEPLREALMAQMEVLATAKEASITPEGARLTW